MRCLDLSLCKGTAVGEMSHVTVTANLHQMESQLRRNAQSSPLLQSLAGCEYRIQFTQYLQTLEKLGGRPRVIVVAIFGCSVGNEATPVFRTLKNVSIVQIHP